MVLSLFYHFGKGASALIETIWMDTTGLENPELLEKAIPFFAEERIERLRKLKNPVAIRLFAGAGLLLYYAMKKNGLDNKINDIQKERYGKPFLPESGFFFNLSHSGSLVLCAFGNINLGADIQQVKETIPQKTEKILSSQEKKFLQAKEGRAQTEAFYQIWAQKESLMKWDGRGLRLPMQSFSVVQDDIPVERMIFEEKAVFFHQYRIPGYAVSICAEQRLFPNGESEKYDKNIKELLKSEFFH